MSREKDGYEALSASATARRCRNSPCMIILVTVVLALKCADGIVLAADSQITDSARGFSYPAQKLHPFGETGAWGGSGARAVLLELETTSTGCRRGAGRRRRRPRVQERVVPLLRHHYDNFIETCRARSSPAPRRPRTSWSRATPGRAVHRRHRPARAHRTVRGRRVPRRRQRLGHGPAGRGAARPLPDDRAGRRHGVLAAVRVLDALRITSPSIGGPIDVYRLTADGAYGLTDEDVERVRERVRQWAELENEVLDRLPRT